MSINERFFLFHLNQSTWQCTLAVFSCEAVSRSSVFDTPSSENVDRVLYEDCEAESVESFDTIYTNIRSDFAFDVHKLIRLAVDMCEKGFIL